MVSAKEPHKYQQFSARNQTDLHRMALLQLEQNYNLPCLVPPRLSASRFNCSDAVEQKAVNGMLKLTPPYKEFSFPIENAFLKASHCPINHGPGVDDKPIDVPCGPKKRFLFFDQSGDRTRLFFSHHQISPPINFFSDNGLSEKVAEQQLNNPMRQEQWDENHLTDEEGNEMHEDTEEINALLYSDSDDECDEDDEVTSTGHNNITPFSIEEVKDESLEKLTAEVSSHDDRSSKRQRLLDGKYKKSSSSLDCSESPSNRAAASSHDDVESSCDDLNWIKREKKVKIHQALEILETIIPGPKGKDPLSIIENAIVYLKSMKTEAKSLGVGYFEPPTTC